MRRSLLVGPADAGRRLADLLADRLGDEAQTLLAAGAVFVDRRRAGEPDAARPLLAGQRLEIEEAPDAPLTDLDVRHADAHVAFVVKPSGVSSTADLRSARGTLLAACQARFGDAHLAGRLDREASGVVLVLLSGVARRAVAALRRAGKVARTYVVLSDRRPRPASGLVDLPIGPDPRRVGRMRIGGEPARPARTAYESTAVGAGVEIVARPRTGRTHQVRLHVAHAGAPVLGDRLYGGAVRLVDASGGVHAVPRLALHCERIALPHPVTGEPIAASCEPPEDFSRLRQVLSTAVPPPPRRGRSPSRG